MASLPSDLGVLVQEAVLADRLRITPIVRMEILYSARSSTEYVALEFELDALRILRDDRAVADAAVRVPVTDALIAAAAAAHGTRPAPEWLPLSRRAF